MKEKSDFALRKITQNSWKVHFHLLSCKLGISCNSTSGIGVFYESDSINKFYDDCENKNSNEVFLFISL